MKLVSSGKAKCCVQEISTLSSEASTAESASEIEEIAHKGTKHNKDPILAPVYEEVSLIFIIIYFVYIYLNKLV